MIWNSFKNKFHRSWHNAVKPFIESEECDEIYAFLKNQKGVEIAPKSNLTFRAFEQPLTSVKCVLIFDEPYSVKQHDLQYADGIPLSCEFVDRIHQDLDRFYHSMEEEFYGLNLEMIKDMNLKYFINQGVLFISSSLTTEIGSPGKHKGLWKSFITHLITKVFKRRKLPIVFMGKDVYEEYESVVQEPYFVVNKPFKNEGVFLNLNNYLFNETKHSEIMWVNQDVPF